MKAILISLAAIVFLAFAFIGLFPKLITGDYCELTVTSLRVDQRGHAQVILKGTHSSGTSHSIWFYSNGLPENYEGASSGGGFPAWPVPWSSRVHFSLNPHHKDLDRATLLSRLGVAEEETYTVKPGKPFTLYQFIDEDGIAREGRVEIP